MLRFREETNSKRGFAVRDTAAGSPRRVSLRGRLITFDSQDSVIDDGIVCIEDQAIRYVGPMGTALPAEFQRAPVVQTGGTIYPGLIELHNHPAYNALPLWPVPAKYASRQDWLTAPAYKRGVAIPAVLLTQHPQDVYPKSFARYAECRALLGGVTTTQGLSVKKLGGTFSYYQGLVRNVEDSFGAGWPIATDHIPDIPSFEDFRKEYGPLVNQPLSRYVMHLCEGTPAATDPFYRNLFDSAGKPLMGSNLIAIHGVGLDRGKLPVLGPSAGLVWSPTSNFLLYGQTADVKAASELGIRIALGCDWAPSGTKNPLGELKVAKIVSDQNGNLFTDLELAKMVTVVPSAMMGWDSFVGSITPGKQADLLVLQGQSGNPYSRLIAATEADILAVLIAGEPRAGRAELVDPQPPGIEYIRIAGQDMVLKLVDDAKHPLANVTLQGATSVLADALAHLPDVVDSYNHGQTATDGRAQTFMLRLELDESLAASILDGTTPINRGDVDPMRLDPITVVDDSTFVGRLKANTNLPRWLADNL